MPSESFYRNRVLSLHLNLKITFSLQYGKSLKPLWNVKLCVQNLYENQTRVGNLIKSSFYNLLKITMFGKFLYFRWNILWTVWRRSNVSLLGPTLANFFICQFLNQLFIDNLMMTNFYFLKQRIMLKSLEITSFLYITISCDNNKLVASVYLKCTFSNVFTNFEGFMV